MPVTEGEWEGNRVVEPEDVGRQIVRAIEENEFWIMTHPEQKPRVKARFDEIVDAMDRAAARARSV